MLNSVNIYQEFQELIGRRNLSNVDIAAAAGVSKAAVGKWLELRKLDDKYIWKIANAFNDPKFRLAVQCYSRGIPAITLKILDRYREDPASILTGSEIENNDSVNAIKRLFLEISKRDPNIKIISSCLKEMLEASEILNTAIDTVAASYGISLRRIAVGEGMNECQR